MTMTEFKLEDFDLIHCGFRKLVRNKESNFLTELFLVLMNKTNDDQTRKTILAFLTALMELLQPVAVIIDLGGERDIELFIATWNLHFYSPLACNYLARLCLALNREEKAHILKDMKSLRDAFLPFHKVITYAGFPDQYKQMLAICREIQEAK
jgi:hypothetical protein